MTDQPTQEEIERVERWQWEQKKAAQESATERSERERIENAIAISAVLTGRSVVDVEFDPAPSGTLGYCYELNELNLKFDDGTMVMFNYVYDGGFEIYWGVDTNILAQSAVQKYRESTPTTG